MKGSFCPSCVFVDVVAKLRREAQQETAWYHSVDQSLVVLQKVIEMLSCQ